MSKNDGKKLSRKCSQKFLDHAKESASNAVKTTSKQGIQKKAEATGDLIDNKIADKITKVSRTSPQNSSKSLKNETENIGIDREIPKEKHVSPYIRQKFIDDLRIIC